MKGFCRNFTRIRTTFFAIAFLGVTMGTGKLVAIDYLESLDLADRELTRMRYASSLEHLAMAREKRPSPDSRYFNLLGEVFYRMENYVDSEMAFLESLKLNPEQPGIYDHLFQYYLSDRKPKEALEMANRYLDFVPDSKIHLYQVAVLSFQTNQSQEAKKYLDILNEDRRFFKEKAPILEEMTELIQNEKWNLASANAEKFILYFPDNVLLHEYRILAHKGKENSKEFKNSRRPDATSRNFENKILYPNHYTNSAYEQSLVEASLIFREDTRFTIKYGNFLQEQGRFFESLQAYRRALKVAMERQSHDSWREILFLMGNVYHKLGRERDKLAVNALNLKLKKPIIDDQELEQLIKTHPKNLEAIQIALFHFKDQAEKKSTLQMKREKLEVELSETELLRVVGPYVFE